LPVVKKMKAVVFVIVEPEVAATPAAASGRGCGEAVEPLPRSGRHFRLHNHKNRFHSS